ncbi:MAG: ACT domain-containing protein [Gammaproteobacteria bacterium]
MNTGETDLEKLLILMQPQLLPGKFVFCSIPDGSYGDYKELQPVASYQEKEGLSLLLDKKSADAMEFEYASVFRGITLNVHSSLEAVGFTAAVSSKLASHGISSNVVAAHFHDHLFVPADRAELALQLLTEFQSG